MTAVQHANPRRRRSADVARLPGVSSEQGRAVQAQTLPASQADIYAMGDCITVDGQVSRHIEPVASQTRTIVAQIRGGGSQPHQVCPIVVRVKTMSMPLALH